MGYPSEQQKITDYEYRYQSKDYYWGLEPSSMCYEIMKLKPPIKPYRLLDMGCGEGKDTVFFAKNGYIVSAFDIADIGLEKGKRLADSNHVDVNFFKANINDYYLDNEFDIIFSSGVLHYMSNEHRKSLLNNYSDCTALNGIHTLNVFINKPFLEPPPDSEPYDTIWSSGELFSYYHN